METCDYGIAVVKICAYNEHATIYVRLVGLRV